VVKELIAFVQGELSARADPAKAGPMAAYMKTAMPFYGIPTPERREVARALRRSYPPMTNDEYRRQVLALWGLPHREEKYLAIGVAISNKEFIGKQNLDLYERLIREGQWWDFVDGVAADLVGAVLASDRLEIAPAMRRWIDDPDMWIRRTAILSQIRHKANTDERMLFDFCRRRANEKEFFIRKAIGWALREYAKVEPTAVRGFLASHGQKLSGLSVREAAKHL